MHSFFSEGFEGGRERKSWKSQFFNFFSQIWHHSHNPFVCNTEDSTRHFIDGYYILFFCKLTTKPQRIIFGSWTTWIWLLILYWILFFGRCATLDRSISMFLVCGGTCDTSHPPSNPSLSYKSWEVSCYFFFVVMGVGVIAMPCVLAVLCALLSFILFF